MKKIFFSSFLLLGCLCFSQNATKKYNSMNQRYEYFDSRGNMTGYEFYNNMTKQWEYYSIDNSSNTEKLQQLDIFNLGSAATVLQGRYDNNTVYVQQEINKMIKSVYRLDISDEQKNKIIQIFKDIPLKSVNSQAINYSSLSTANDVLNYLSTSLNKIIKNVTSNDKNNDTLSKFYNNKYKVNKIMIFDDPASNGEVKIQSDSYVIITENQITFKTAEGRILQRTLFNKRYTERNGGGYDYNSDAGGVFIQKDLNLVEFFESYDPDYGKKNYTYYINYKF